MYSCKCVYRVHIHRFMSIDAHTRIRMCIHARVSVHARVYTCTYVLVSVHVPMCIHTHVSM